METVNYVMPGMRNYRCVCRMKTLVVLDMVMNHFLILIQGYKCRSPLQLQNVVCFLFASFSFTYPERKGRTVQKNRESGSQTSILNANEG